MILSCPTCSTRYRHEVLPVGSPARCGQCARVFPVPPARSYFVVAVSPARRPLEAAFAPPAAGALHKRLAPASPARRTGSRGEAGSSDIPAPWSEAVASIAVGMGAGVLLAFVFNWPVATWAVIGAVIGPVGRWGWRRWTSARS